MGACECGIELSEFSDAPETSWLAEHLLDSKERLLLMSQIHKITFHDVYQFLNVKHIL